MDAHAFELLGRGTYSTNCLTEVHFMVHASKVFLVTGATDGYIAVWPVDWIIPEGSDRFSVNETSTGQTLKWKLQQGSAETNNTMSPDDSVVYTWYVSCNVLGTLSSF